MRQDSNKTSDEELILKFCQGDREAMGEIYSRYQRRVLSTCHSYSKCPHIAEELTQECFIQLIRKAHLFRGESKFSTWLFRLSSNICGMYLRSHSQNHKHIIPESNVCDVEMEAALKRQSLTELANEDGVLLRKYMQNAYLCIPKHFRPALKLACAHELGSTLAAEVLGETVPATKSSLWRARQIFKKRILPVARELDLAA
jgi:RNA polymerase sigma-70 factor (ECF subfamily)